MVLEAGRKGADRVRTNEPETTSRYKTVLAARSYGETPSFSAVSFPLRIMRPGTVMPFTLLTSPVEGGPTFGAVENCACLDPGGIGLLRVPVGFSPTITVLRFEPDERLGADAKLGSPVPEPEPDGVPRDGGVKGMAGTFCCPTSPGRPFNSPPLPACMEME